MSSVSWSSAAYRVFAITNFIFVAVGLLFLLPDLWSLYKGAMGNTPEYPYFVRVFWTMVSVNLGLLGLLALGRIRLWRLDDLGVSICNVTFATEILYFIGIGFLWGATLPQEVTRSIAAATGVGNIGISPQVVSGYPLVGLIALNCARRSRKKAALVATAQREASGSIPG